MAKCEEMRGGNASEQMEQIGVIGGNGGVGHEKDTTAAAALHCPLLSLDFLVLSKLEATRDTNHGLAMMAVAIFPFAEGISAFRPSTESNADAILLVSAKKRLAGTIIL